MSSKSLVSILCAVKNESKFITAALESVINQSYNNFELICIDDFSDDKTLELLNQYSNKNPRIKVYSNTLPGKNNAYNLAFNHSKGNYIVFFAGDDLMTSNSITSRLNTITDNSSIHIVSGRIQSFSSLSHKITIYPKKSGYNHSGGAILMKRKMAEEIFPIPIKLPNEDAWIDLHTSYLEKNKSFTDDIVLLYRIHENNSSKLKSDFAIRNVSIHKRRNSLNIFLEKYKHLLNNKKILSIERKIILEKLRYEGKTLAIIIFRTESFKEKLHNIVFSSKAIYYLRNIFYSTFSGR